MTARAALSPRPRGSCRWDLVSLGEVMLRFDPGDARIASTRTFRVWEGGGEYNVARALAHAFALDTTIVTALVDNPVGRLVEDLIRQGGVGRSHIRWHAHDGVGRAARNGLNFLERGFGARGPQGCSDRGHTAVAQLQPGEIDWDTLFAREGARWFHTGGVFAGLSDTTPAVALEAMRAARRHGAVVSFDLNYRASLWQARGGKARADAVNRELIAQADVLFGAENLDAPPSPRALDSVRRAIDATAANYPNLAVVATTLRRVTSASRHDWGGLCATAGVVHEAPLRADLDVLDRVGAGDAFAAGVIHGFLGGHGPQYAVDCGAACGALAMTTPGDALFATRAEVEALMRNAGADVAR